MSEGPGKFFSFEGGEGAGKTTQIKLLADKLHGRGLEVITVREPGGTPDAESLRDLVLGGEPGRWSPKEEMLLMYTARSTLVRTVIRPALARGAWVLSDRFADSTMVYQGVGGGVPLQEIRQLHLLVLGDFNPDITFIMDIDPDNGMRRVHTRAEVLNQFEKRDALFYKRARQAYLDIAAAAPGRCAVIDAAETPAAVAARIWQTVQSRVGINDGDGL